MAMTSKERMMTALRREIPDRLPATVHQWQPYHLAAYLDGVGDMEAFRRFKLDAAITRFPLLDTETDTWKTGIEQLGTDGDEERFRITVTTPDGTLEKEIGRNQYTEWDITHFVKDHDDIRLFEKYLPVPRLDKAVLQQEYDALGDDGIMRGFTIGDQGGCWQHACCLYGTENLIIAAMESPEWVHEFLGVLLEKKLQFIEENLHGAAYDLIETGGGAASTTVISPTYYKEFCLPYDRKMHDAIHAAGLPAVYHTCGGMMPILEQIVENGCEAAETLTPSSMGGDARPAELKQRIGDQVALIGGLDQNSVMEVGTPQQIIEHVQEMFAIYGKGGGYIACPSDHFFHIPPENLEAYAAAAHTCTY